jgi:polyprenyldihydroxybenzoate methyltransferase / 3-demethylubiquinol 3-O-methyltransferase
VEHVDNQKEFLLNCMKLVKPSTGHLFVSTIAKTFEGWFLTIALGEYVTRMLPLGTHEWNQYINIEDVEGILRSGGGQTIDRSGIMVTNPLTMEMGEFPNWHRANYMLISKRITV